MLWPFFFAHRGRVTVHSGARSAPRGLRLEPLEARRLFTLDGHQLFPSDNPWNTNIANAPVAANSATLVASIGASSPLHPDFGTMYQGANIGIPYNVVTSSQPKINVVIDAFPGESDIEPVPIPANAVIEGDPLAPEDNDTDRHLIVYDSDANVSYELYNVHRPSEEQDGQWHADSEAVWNMNQDSFRTPGDTSADAAGLPILPGLVRTDETLVQGAINHALRFTVPKTDSAYVFPASHEAGVNNTAYPRMGERFRLKQNVDISGFPPEDQVILQALKTYGMIVADNGSSWYLSGAPSADWSDDDLHQLTQILGNEFEAVNLTPLVASLGQSSGSVSGGTQVTIHGQNFTGVAGQLQVFFGGTAATNVSVQSDGMLVATAPSHSAGSVDVTIQTPYGTSATSPADRFTFSAQSQPAVVGTHLFYRDSSKWDVTNGATFSDDNAIAADKTAYLANGTATSFSNVSSYSQGINGIMVDLAGTHGTLSSNDFTFKAGDNNAPSSWSATTAPQIVMTRPAAGNGGSDRIELEWASGAVLKSKWLEVIVKGNDTLGGHDTNTGLSASYVFFYGSAPGDTGLGDSGAFVVDSSDGSSVLTHPHSAKNPAAIADTGDFNRDGSVDSSDGAAVLANGTTSKTALVLLSITAGGPFASSDDVAASTMPLLAASEAINANGQIAAGLAASQTANSQVHSSASGPPPEATVRVSTITAHGESSYPEDDQRWASIDQAFERSERERYDDAADDASVDEAFRATAVDAWSG
ncbi:MAG TPA: IPT/TIG domain-containing protein [Pirellulales bacterium]|nr:IPT/TIG domain-containing protein [Pirellulales bacterium]